MNMLQIFGVGTEIGGYCSGYFGRDDYSNKTCVMCAPSMLSSRSGKLVGLVCLITLKA